MKVSNVKVVEMQWNKYLHIIFQDLPNPHTYIFASSYITEKEKMKCNCYINHKCLAKSTRLEKKIANLDISSLNPENYNVIRSPWEGWEQSLPNMLIGTTSACSNLTNGQKVSHFPPTFYSCSKWYPQRFLMILILENNAVNM